MNDQTRHVPRKIIGEFLLPSHIYHPDFSLRSAGKNFETNDLEEVNNFEIGFMPDEVTKDHARRMHFAAHRIHTARTQQERLKWQKIYLNLRDRIVLGNRKLIYKAIRQKVSLTNYADDLTGDCHIVLIQAVAAFNPWIGIRFSTYAFTCLIRAISRLSQKITADRNNRAIPLEAIPFGEPNGSNDTPVESSNSLNLDEYLREEHPLLTAREKSIIGLRFSANNENGSPTLERVGEVIGLSKERVRQVQTTALQKLRTAIFQTT